MNKARETQIKRYGGEAGYRAEMARRRSLVKNYYLQDNKGAAKALANKRWEGGKKAEKAKPLGAGVRPKKEDQFLTWRAEVDEQIRQQNKDEDRPGGQVI